jgi:hypothetical protein
MPRSFNSPNRCANRKEFSAPWFNRGGLIARLTRAMIMASPELAGIVQKGMAGSKVLTREEFDQWTLVCRSLFITVEDSFMQRKAGLLDDVAFHSFEAGTSTFLSSPGLRASWQLASSQYGKETRKFIDSMIKQSPAAGPTDAYSDWIRLLQTQETA